MTTKAQASPLTSQVTLTVLALAALAIAMVLGFGFFATTQADQDSLARQKQFVENGIAEQVEDVVRQQQSVTVWDDSIVNARAGNQQWMAENLGAWMHDYYGHDRVYVLDARNRPVHAMQDGRTVAPISYDAEATVFGAAIRKLRGLIVEARSTPENPPALVVSDLVTLAGHTAILSIQPLLPNSGRLEQMPGSEFLHISVQFLDGEIVGKIAAQYQIAGARDLSRDFAPLPSANVALRDAGGAVLGYVAWNQDRPGLTLIRQTGPALIAGLFLAAGVLWFLLRRLRRASRALQLSQDAAQFLAFHDTLTGLPNRALFEDRLKRALLGVRRGKGMVALLYLDLDRFKQVNDTLGHPAGDALVKQAAQRLVRSVRAVDTTARLGGDEFAIILVDVRDLTAAEALCGRLLGEIGAPFDLAGDQVYVGVSIGVAVAADAGADPADLLRKADIALYEAKKNGRGRYEVFAGDMDDILVRKRAIERDLRQALVSERSNRIKLVYQPVYDTHDGTIAGAEALIRWAHPAHEALSPQHIVSIAEERGMISLLGDHVLREATRFAATSSLPWIAVNVSPLQLRDEGYPAHVLAILAETCLPPWRLQLEVAEGVLIDGSEVSKSILAELRATGIRVVLDDFGTGYSSINYLRNYQIDKLKIDRSFVRLLGSSEESAAIVKALIDLAAAMKVRVTAEGVETREQRDLLAGMGCHELQGFFLSPPLTMAQLRELGAWLPAEKRQAAVKA